LQHSRKCLPHPMNARDSQSSFCGFSRLSSCV
jgi:hypothetical protein